MRLRPGRGLARGRRLRWPLLALAAAFSCAGEPSSGDLVLQPVVDLVALRDSEATFPSLPACAIGDETRPAIGCLLPTQLGMEKGVVAEGGVIRGRRYQFATRTPIEALLVERSFRRGERDGWSALAPELVHRPGSEVEVSYPLPADAPTGPLAVSARASVLPAAEQTTVTRPVRIGRGAVLTVGLGIVPAVRDAGAAPVDARLLARVGGGERELLRVVLDPMDPQVEWHDHRIALDELAGQSVRFVFATVPAPGAQPGAPVAPVWGAPRVMERRRRHAPNLLLISLDTLRADYIGAYGSTLPTTPALDRVAAEGTLFEHVTATYPSTPGSHMSMMTGVYPNVHGVIGPYDTLPAGLPTLAEILATRGWQTGAVTEDGMLVAGAGFQRGFAYYRENKGPSIWEATGQVDVTFRNGLRWLEANRDTQFFLFLHTYQVHSPYLPPPEFDRFRTYREGNRDVPITPQTPGAIRGRHAYAGETLYTDHEVGRLLDGIRAMGLDHQTVVVFTSDHGEEFGEHGRIGHDKTLYEEVLHVPLILRARGLVPAGVRVARQASLVDLAPTLLELLDVPVPASMQGRSLVPYLSDPEPGDAAPVFAELLKRGEGRRSISARQGARKWIWHEPATVPAEVYDLGADPGERRNLATPSLLAEGEALRHRYEGFGRGTKLRPGPTTPPPPLDPKTEEKLRALGYIQ